MSQNGLALSYVKDQTVEICLAALKEDKYAYKDVKIVDNPDYETTLQNLKKKQSLKQKIAQVS